jgi:carnitine-CoA ligase
LRHYGANHVMTLGAMHVFLVLTEPREDDADNPLRTMVMNPIIPGVFEAFVERFKVERVASGFGQSEIMGASMWRDDLGLSPASAGLLNSETSPVELALLDEHDEPVPVGTPGEICVRGRKPFILFSGYFNEPEKSMETFRNLWHHTGDLGREDDSGELYFVDRKKDSTRYKGRNISSFEVESVARRFPGVAAIAAYGVPSAVEFEDELILAVIPAEGTTIEPLELCKFIDEHAPYFFVPRYVWITDELPMTPTNKVQKFKLRDAGLPADAWDLESHSEWRPTRKDYRAL